MKKILFAVCLIAILLTSCVKENEGCDVFEFSQRLNNICGTDFLNTDKLVYSEKDGVAYWFPENNQNACVSFYINNKTGNIEKCNVVFKNKKQNDTLKNNIKTALSESNKYIVESCFKTEKYILFTFEDSKFVKKQEKPTLKKDIKEEDLY